MEQRLYRSEDVQDSYRSEDVQDSFGAYTCQWYCPPPRAGVNYSIVKDWWSEDLSIRRILEIRIHD